MSNHLLCKGTSCLSVPGRHMQCDTRLKPFFIFMSCETTKPLTSVRFIENTKHVQLQYFFLSSIFKCLFKHLDYLLFHSSTTIILPCQHQCKFSTVILPSVSFKRTKTAQCQVYCSSCYTKLLLSIKGKQISGKLVSVLTGREAIMFDMGIPTTDIVLI